MKDVKTFKILYLRHLEYLLLLWGYVKSWNFRRYFRYIGFKVVCNYFVFCMNVPKIIPYVPEVLYSAISLRRIYYWMMDRVLPHSFPFTWGTKPTLVSPLSCNFAYFSIIPTGLPHLLCWYTHALPSRNNVMEVVAQP